MKTTGYALFLSSILLPSEGMKMVLELRLQLEDHAEHEQS